jgi:formylglycine-generating enzyme required for sulfatase activity
MDWDVFISHAWEDKEDIARPLAEALRQKGLLVWYDEFTLTLGDSLRRAIDRGLAQSRYGVVILSPNFFAKEWPQRELDGLVAREISSGKVILPVWHNVTWEDVSRFSPTLADKLAVSTTKGLDAVVEEILRALRVDLKAGPTGEEHRPRPHSVPELEMVLIPASEFLMGTEEENVDAIVAEYNTELERIRREVPQRPVFVEEFEIAKYPVTNAEFQRFVEATGYRTQAEKNGYGNIWKGSTWDQVKGANWHHPQGPHSSLEGKMNYPVVQVSWHDAVAYCEWLSEKTGKPYRLPFEKEWEKVARGTDSREFPWGDEWDESKCKTAQGGPGTTTPVGQYSPHGDSPYGVADMAGNVWEWCTDWFQAYQGNPFPDEYYGEMSKRVLRGGSWKDSRVGARCAYREGDPPDHMDDRIGFRCVRGFSSWQKVLLRLRGLILDKGWSTVLRSPVTITLAVLLAIALGAFSVLREYVDPSFMQQTPHTPAASPSATEQLFSTLTPVPTFPPIDILTEINRDDFSFASSGWDNYSAADGKAIVGYEDRKYFLQIRGPSLIYVAVWAGGGLYDNGVFQVDALAPQDTASALSQGIVIGWNKEGGKHYAFDFTYTGLCRFFEGTGTGWSPKESTVISAFDPEKPFHVVTVQVRNNEAVGYIDGKFCASYVMPEYRRGMVGVVGSLRQGGTRLYFDNFRVWDLP